MFVPRLSLFEFGYKNKNRTCAGGNVARSTATRRRRADKILQTVIKDARAVADNLTA
jgi:hypothetical protein